MSEPYQPLSVRTGQRAPLPYHEGVPGHLRQALEDIVYREIVGMGDDFGEALILQLQIPGSRPGMYQPARISGYYRSGIFQGV